MRYAAKRMAGLLLSVTVALTASTAAGATQLDASLAGVWEQHGYGKIFEISATRLTTYDTTEISCVKLSEQPLAEANRKYDRISREGDGFAFFEVGAITRYAFRRVQELPKLCRQQSAAARDPVTNFSVLWQAFHDHYAFFATRKVQWNDIKARFQPRINSVTSEEDLFNVFSEMLRPLDDGHVVLRAGARKFSGGSQGELLEWWKSKTGSDTGYEAAVRKHVFDDVLKGKAQRGANDTIIWGWAAPGVGYIDTTTMDLSPASDYGMPLTEQLQLVERTMAAAMKDLGGARSLIIDARFNDGGYDAVALKIMGSFTRDRRLAFTKKAVAGQGYTPAQEIYFGPSGATQFTGPIYYLQSGMTMSAAEIFTLAMLALPNVTRIGTPTYGVFSDELAKQLPNGWSVTLSNEVYLAPDGSVYEGRGVPPQVPVAAGNARDLQQRLRLDIDAALSLARGNTKKKGE